MGAGEGYTGYYPAMLQDPYLVIFSLKARTHGQMKGILEVSMRFLRKGPEWVLEWSQNDPRIDPSRLVPRCPSDAPYPDLRNLKVYIWAYLRFY